MYKLSEAMILAGGPGTRLRSVVSDVPKVLARVNGRPFITYLLDQVAATEIRKVVLCTGYMGSTIQDELGDTYHNLKLEYSQETTRLDTAGALRLALSLLQSDVALVMNGDSIYLTDLEAFWQWHQAREAKASLCLTHVPDMSRYGQIRIESSGEVIKFDEKGASGGSGWINAGIYLFGREVLQSIPPDQPISLEKEVFPDWIGKGLYGYKGSGPFLDIGTPESYAEAEKFLA